MAKNKTTETVLSVDTFLDQIKDENKKADCKELTKFFEKTVGAPAKMWGPSIIGFGSYHYKYESGREGDWMQVGFSPRSAAITLYLSASFDGREELLAEFGKHKTDKSCIYIKSLSDVSLKVLEKMVKNHLKQLKELYK